MSSTQINPKRGGGTGAGRRKREVTKQSIYFDKDMWQASRLLAQRLEFKHSPFLRRVMQIGVEAISAAITQDQIIKINDNYEHTKRSIYFSDDIWDDAHRIAKRLSIDHSVVLRYAIRIGMEAMNGEVHRG
jgi:hypothetical protein